VGEGAPAGPADRSYAVYSPRLLRWYDALVLGLSNRWIWRCPTSHLLAHFDRHISANHLDVGVGTGYFLDRCRFPARQPRIVLLDPNPNCLEAAGRRLARYAPQTVVADATRPLSLGLEPFDSISLNYVLHCLSGTLPEKAAILDHLRPLMKPGGVLFGSTLLAHGVPTTWPARRLMAAYNRRGIFGNAADSLLALREALASRFTDVAIDTVGCVAIFAAK
jgi:ubiquinone/menaquinone biosynthesis C-methylase UbiE